MGQNSLIEAHTPYSKRPSEERCGEQAKVKKNVFQSKVTSVSRWKSSTKGER
jgi:hypothetical protein